MKRIFAVLCAAWISLSLTACAAGEADVPREPDVWLPVAPVETLPVSQPVQEDLPDPEPVWTAAEGVTFSLLQDAYPAGTTGITLVIDNRSDLEIGFGSREIYEKYVDGQWRMVDGIDELAFRDVLWTFAPQSVCTRTLTALRCVQPLEEGLYRVTGDSVFADGEELSAWQVSFRIEASAQPEPDYALYISGQPIPTVDGCAVTDRLPVYFINNTGKDGHVLEIPHLEKLDEDGVWSEVPYKDGVGFCGTPSGLPAAGMAWSEDISMLWGSLEDGQYRLSYAAGPAFDTEETASGTFTLCTPENNAGLPLASRE